MVFATDWYAETAEDLAAPRRRVRPRRRRVPTPDATSASRCAERPGFVTENNLRLFNSMFYRARDGFPDQSVLRAGRVAAVRRDHGRATGRRGGAFVCEEADQFMVAHAQRSYYAALLEAGVRIWLYPSPFVLHAKHFTVDDDLAVIGSSNMDYRSFALNYEVVMMLTSPPRTSVRVVQDEYRSLSRELTLEEWRAMRGGVRRQRDASDRRPAVSAPL